MASCEKCWGDAYILMMNGKFESQSEAYTYLVKERNANPCSIKEQAGQFWDEERQADTRFEED